MPSNPKYRVECVHPALLGEMWPFIGPILLRGTLEATHGDMQEALTDLLSHVLAAHRGESVIWVAFDPTGAPAAALITELIAEDGRKLVWVSRMAG
ncbi:MAG: hypothetical protein JSS20_18125, partial [Proteobacteria bacterium]|nr:hypothetical protein [Pseudomonadota bacterium]